MSRTIPSAGQGFPLSGLPPEVAGPMRPHLEAAAVEMVKEIQGLVPEYARPPESRYGRRMRWAVQETVRQFVDAIGRPDMEWEGVTGIFEGIGAYEARKGRSLDGLQAAVRVSGQVACRRFIKDARRLGWSLDTLGCITESLFVFLERVASAAAQGYARAQGELAGERERFRWRLRDLLVMDPPASTEAIEELARSAGWPVPRTLAAVALRPDPGGAVPVLPPVLLVDCHASDPYLICPDPDGPGRDRLLAAIRGTRAAAERLLVHEQTVRYRIRRLEEILGGGMSDPDRRVELLLLLHHLIRLDQGDRRLSPADRHGRRG